MPNSCLALGKEKRPVVVHLAKQANNCMVVNFDLFATHDKVPVNPFQ